MPSLTRSQLRLRRVLGLAPPRRRGRRRVAALRHVDLELARPRRPARRAARRAASRSSVAARVAPCRRGGVVGRRLGLGPRGERGPVGREVAPLGRRLDPAPGPARRAGSGTPRPPAAAPVRSAPQRPARAGLRSGGPPRSACRAVVDRLRRRVDARRAAARSPAGRDAPATCAASSRSRALELGRPTASPPRPLARRAARRPAPRRAASSRREPPAGALRFGTLATGWSQTGHGSPTASAPTSVVRRVRDLQRLQRVLRLRERGGRRRDRGLRLLAPVPRASASAAADLRRAPRARAARRASGSRGPSCVERVLRGCVDRRGRRRDRAASACSQRRRGLARGRRRAASTVAGTLTCSSRATTSRSRGAPRSGRGRFALQLGQRVARGAHLLAQLAVDRDPLLLDLELLRRAVGRARSSCCSASFTAASCSAAPARGRCASSARRRRSRAA